MSQAKVDRYKKEKANRKKTLAMNKIKRKIAIVCGWAVLVAIVAWAGVSGYNYYESKKPSETYYCQTDPLSDYISGLSADEHDHED